MFAVTISSGACSVSAAILFSRRRSGELRVQDRIRAGRAAAQMRIAHRHELEAEREQQRFDLAADLQAVLERARRRGKRLRRGTGERDAAMSDCELRLLARG